MNPMEFDHEMQIMIREYKSAFSLAKLGLIWNFVQDIEAIDLRRINSHFLASMKGPPLPINYRDAAREEKRHKESRGIQSLEELSKFHERNMGLQAYLAKAFPGCKTLMEAVEVRKIQIQIAKAKDPSYDPMTDKAWGMT